MHSTSRGATRGSTCAKLTIVDAPMMMAWPNWAPDDYDRRDLDVFTPEDVEWLDRMWATTGCPPRDPFRPDPRTGTTIQR